MGLVGRYVRLTTIEDNLLGASLFREVVHNLPRLVQALSRQVDRRRYRASLIVGSADINQQEVFWFVCLLLLLLEKSEHLTWFDGLCTRLGFWKGFVPGGFGSVLGRHSLAMFVDEQWHCVDTVLLWFPICLGGGRLTNLRSD
jgi:hypothetical protein